MMINGIGMMIMNGIFDDDDGDDGDDDDDNDGR